MKVWRLGCSWQSSLSAQQGISWETGLTTRTLGPWPELGSAAAASILPEHLGPDGEQGAVWANSWETPKPLNQGREWMSRRPQVLHQVNLSGKHVPHAAQRCRNEPISVFTYTSDHLDRLDEHLYIFIIYHVLLFYYIFVYFFLFSHRLHSANLRPCSVSKCSNYSYTLLFHTV